MRRAMAAAVLVVMVAGSASAQQADPSATVAASDSATAGQTLKWTGVGLLIGSALFMAGSFTFNDSKGCGFLSEWSCDDVGPAYRYTSGALLVGGVTVLLVDEARRQRGKTGKRIALDVSPRAVRVNVSF
jgi:hypothetical protein